MQTIEVPEPIGEVYCHRHVNGTVEHHETPWEGDQAECRYCGIKAVVSLKPLEEFTKDHGFLLNLMRKIRKNKAKKTRGTVNVLIIKVPKDGS